jgi:hypothetical protein
VNAGRQLVEPCPRARRAAGPTASSRPVGRCLVSPADRLARYGERLIDAVRHGDPSDAINDLAGLDRAELEHVLLLLAARVPTEAQPHTVDDLVQERFATIRRRRR